MTSRRGEARSQRGDQSQEKITLSLPAEFFQIVSDEFESALNLIDSQQTILRAAECARAEEAAQADQSADEDALSSPEDGDRLSRLVRELLDKDIDELQIERAESHRHSYPIASAELYHAAKLIGEQARHRLSRLAIAFDQIAGDPVRRELARRQIEKSAEKRSKASD
jgi:hypothetical protein